MSKDKKDMHKTEDVVSTLHYESMRDNALEMARVLRAIDSELRDAAITGLREDNGYSPRLLLANLCEIMYSCYVNFKDKTFD